MKNAVYYEMQANQFSEKEWKEMGDRIKESCKAAGYKHTDLAGFPGIERQHMYRILKGMLPCKSEYIYEIAQILGVSTDYLFSEIRRVTRHSKLPGCWRGELRSKWRLRKIY